MRKIAFAVLLVLATTVVYAQNTTYQLSSHILDISTGMPATGVPVELEKLNTKTQKWKQVDKKVTDQNGRIKDFLTTKNDNEGVYRLRFLVADYFKSKKQKASILLSKSFSR